MADIRNIISFAQDEFLIREYFAFKMFFPVKARINLSVTNKRLIAFSYKQSMLNFEDEALYQQINIEDVRGLEILQVKRYSIGMIIACGIFLFIGGIMYSMSATLPIFGLPGILFMFGGIVGISLCLAFPNKVFTFQVKGVTQNLNVGELISLKPVISVGPDLPKIVQELGALIIEIQDGAIYNRK